MAETLACPRCGTTLTEHCRTVNSEVAKCGWVSCPEHRVRRLDVRPEPGHGRPARSGKTERLGA